MEKTNYEFQSEVKQLLNILVHSLYKEKEIFLRELVSNAIDALNKVKFKSLTQDDVDDDKLELKIDISFNKKQKKIVIEDTGIGMTKNELVKNIGTIAHSGAVEFLKKASKTDEKDMDLIGQFGVGFYSSFIVAKKIHLYTKSFKKSSQAQLWISKGDNNYTIEKAVKKHRGTRIELFLRDDCDEFLEQSRIENIISTHSKFLPFNLYVEGKKTDTIPPIWSQPKSALKEKDYHEFYKSIDFSGGEPESYLHLSSDAPVQFNSVLFIPKSSFESMGFMKEKPAVDLYSKKVLIQKGNEDIFPEYLRFVKGIIDSEDIPLNISRETVQNNIKIRKIKKHLLKKFFSHLENLKKNDQEKYLKIWDNFNKNFKEGIIQDFEYKQKLSELLLFNSSKSTDKYTDLADYVERMGKDQKEIYYVSGNDIESVRSNPALEVFFKKDIEVLFLINPIDEFVLENLRDYKEKSFKAIEAADIKADKEKEKDKETLKKADNLITYLKTTYQDRVEDVKVSERLFDSPCMLSHPQNSPSIQMEKIMKMTNKDFKYSKRVLEINPGHELIKEMSKIQESDPAAPKLKTIALQMLDNMLLREGILDNIDSVIPRIQDIMLDALKNK